MTISRTHSSSSLTPSASLDDVLRVLGHDCPLGCARASAELDADVWLTRTALPLPSIERPTLVVIDSSASQAPPTRTFQLVRFVDRCARSDGIRVRERRASDHELTALPAQLTTTPQGGPALAMSGSLPLRPGGR